MARLAFLPDKGTLNVLLEQVRAPVVEAPPRTAQQTVPAAGNSVASHPSSVPTQRDSSPPHEALSMSDEELSVPRDDVPESRDSMPIARDSVPASRGRRLDPALLLADFSGQLGEAKNLEQRLRCLTTWLELRVPAKAVFVADAEGLGLTDGQDNEPYLAVAGQVGTVFDKLSAILPRASEGVVALELQADQQLVLVGCKADLGRFSVGLVLDAPLEPVWPSVVREALCQIAVRDEGSR